MTVLPPTAAYVTILQEVHVSPFSVKDIVKWIEDVSTVTVKHFN